MKKGKIMKKFLTIALVAVMMMTFAVSAFAEITALGGSESQDVTVNVQETTSTTVYSVTVTWEDNLAFEYANATYVWDPENLCYVQQGGSWVDDTKTITITNKSNAKVRATVEAEATANGITLTPSAAVEIESAAAGIADYTQATTVNSGEAKTGKITLTISGTPTGLSGSGNKVGTATVKIEAAE